MAAENVDLTACPRCDALHRISAMEKGTRLRCVRCNTILATSREGTAVYVIALAVTTVILIIAAIFLPFLTITVGQASNQTSLFGAVMAFQDGILLPLAISVAGLIVFIPLLRSVALVYALGPVVLKRPVLPSSRTALRLAEDLKPWSMAEVFIVGVAVSMVKIAGLASVSFGAAFWAIVALVVVTLIKDMVICKWSLWAALR